VICYSDYKANTTKFTAHLERFKRIVLLNGKYVNIANKNRRTHKDIWVYITRTLAIFGWLAFSLALLVSSYAAPDTNYGLDRYHEVDIRDYWLTPLTGYLYIILWISALSSYLCLLIDHFRNRRKSDNKHFNLILLLLISIAWLSYILIDIKQ